MNNHIDPADAGKEQDIAYAVWLNDRQREQRAAQQHDENEHARAVDEGTYTGSYSQRRGEN